MELLRTVCPSACPQPPPDALHQAHPMPAPGVGDLWRLQPCRLGSICCCCCCCCCRRLASSPHLVQAVATGSRSSQAAQAAGRGLWWRDSGRGKALAQSLLHALHPHPTVSASMLGPGLGEAGSERDWRGSERREHQYCQGPCPAQPCCEQPPGVPAQGCSILARGGYATSNSMCCCRTAD